MWYGAAKFVTCVADSSCTESVFGNDPPSEAADSNGGVSYVNVSR